MEVILHVDEGPEKGRTFHFKEADNLLIGREDPTSKAHVNIGPEDPYISRHHFIIEIRPPNCLVRDNGSTNGVFIRYKGRRKWERIAESRVNDGDRIKIGKTILSVLVQGQVVDRAESSEPEKARFFEPKKTNRETPLNQTEPAGQPEFTCIRCGTVLTDPPVLGEAAIHDLDFMCPHCKIEATAVKTKTRSTKGGIECRLCGRDLTDMANLDGRAQEMQDCCVYYCPSCIHSLLKMRSQEIGEYVLVKEMGRGGMGQVFQAWHKKTGRVVALKILLPMVRVDQTQVLRFIREVNIMNELTHPGLVRLFEAGQCGDSSFFVLEYVPDGNLNQFISNIGEPLLSPEESVRLIIQSLEGLYILHKNGYVHRDIKPENILIRRMGDGLQPKLTDFGLARSYERHGGTITKSGECAGTLMYMPPEQVLGFKNSKPQVDIYAMGVTLYYLLTGKYSLKFPTQAERNQGIFIDRDPVLMILEDDPIPIQERRADLPESLCRVVNTAVSKESRRRYQTAEELADELRKAIH